MNVVIIGKGLAIWICNRPTRVRHPSQEKKGSSLDMRKKEEKGVRKKGSSLDITLRVRKKGSSLDITLPLF